jgi:hypothetical protein
MYDLRTGAGAGYSRHEMLALRARRGGKCGIRRRSTVIPTAVSRHVLIDGSRLSKAFPLRDKCNSLLNGYSVSLRGAARVDIGFPQDRSSTRSKVEEPKTMNISRIARAAVVAAGIGLSTITFGIGPVSAEPASPAPAPGPAMGPGTSTPPTTNITRPGVGPGGAHGGQNQTKAPGS